MSAGTRTAASAAEAAQGAGASGSAVTPSDVRLVAGRLAPDELAALRARVDKLVG